MVYHYQQPPYYLYVCNSFKSIIAQLTVIGTTHYQKWGRKKNTDDSKTLIRFCLHSSKWLRYTLINTKFINQRIFILFTQLLTSLLTNETFIIYRDCMENIKFITRTLYFNTDV